MSSTAPAVSAPPATAPRVVRDEWRIRYEYPTGEVAARFFDALKERRIVATHCSASGMTYLPPRAYCERSFERCDGFVEAGSEGTIEAATIVSAAFENLPPPPYAIAYVRLDGVSTAMLWPSGDKIGRPLNAAFLKKSAIGMDSSARALAPHRPVLSKMVLSTRGIMRRFKTVSFCIHINGHGAQ